MFIKACESIKVNFLILNLEGKYMLKKIHHIGIAVRDFKKIKILLNKYFEVP